MFCHIDYIHIHIFMIVTILFVGSIPNFGINIIEPRQDVLKVIYFAKDVHQACHKMAPMLVSCSGEDAHRSGSISSGYTVFSGEIWTLRCQAIAPTGIRILVHRSGPSFFTHCAFPTEEILASDFV